MSTEPILPIGAKGKMLGQVPHLAAAQTILKEVNLKDVLLLPISAHKLCSVEAHKATNTEQGSATATVGIARAATLGLTRSHNLHLHTNQIGIHSSCSTPPHQQCCQ